MNPADLRAQVMRIAEGNPSATKLLTTQEAAALLGVEPGTLRTWRHRKQTPPTLALAERVVGLKCIRYDPVQLQAYLDEMAKATTDEVSAREHAKALGPGRRTPSPKQAADG